MLNEEELGEFIDARFTKNLFRLETLERYDVASDDADFGRYLRGEREPNAAIKEAWLEQLRREAAEGKRNERVHVLTSPLNDYLRYECEWGYVYNMAAGEDIRIVDLAEIRRLADRPTEDFFLIDDLCVVRMRYDEAGRFVGAEPDMTGEAVERARATRDVLWATAVPFQSWWDAHPQYWRRNWAA